MAKGTYKLLVPHYFPGDHYLDAGMIVGDGTAYPVEGPPSMGMEAVDAAANEEIKAHGGRLRPIESLPVKMGGFGNNPAPGPGQHVLHHGDDPANRVAIAAGSAERRADIPGSPERNNAALAAGQRIESSGPPAGPPNDDGEHPVPLTRKPAAPVRTDSPIQPEERAALSKAAEEQSLREAKERAKGAATPFVQKEAAPANAPQAGAPVVVVPAAKPSLGGPPKNL